jgi:hypothetical protein
MSLQEGVYWAILHVVYCLCFVWFITAIVIVLKLDIRLDNYWFCRNFGYYAEITLPVLSNSAFLPIMSILLDVNVCTESVGDNYSDSYLDRDCHVWCWESEHIVYVALALVSLVLYVPLAVLTRPMWQFYLADLHIFTIPKFLMLKTMF